MRSTLLWWWAASAACLLSGIAPVAVLDRNQTLPLSYGWNAIWLLIIPRASLCTDPDALKRYVDTVQDIEVQFQTDSNPGL